MDFLSFIDISGVAIAIMAKATENVLEIPAIATSICGCSGTYGLYVPGSRATNLRILSLKLLVFIKP